MSPPTNTIRSTNASGSDGGAGSGVAPATAGYVAPAIARGSAPAAGCVTRSNPSNRVDVVPAGACTYVTAPLGVTVRTIGTGSGLPPTLGINVLPVVIAAAATFPPVPPIPVPTPAVAPATAPLIAALASPSPTTNFGPLIAAPAPAPLMAALASSPPTTNFVPVIAASAPLPISVPSAAPPLAASAAAVHVRDAPPVGTARARPAMAPTTPPSPPPRKPFFLTTSSVRFG